MYRQARNAARPAQMVRLPRILPLSRLNGATPTRAATCRRVSEPSSGSCASNVEIAHVLHPLGRDVVEELLRREPVRIDQGDAFAGFDVLAEHVEHERALAGAGLADDVEPLPAIRAGDAENAARCAAQSVVLPYEGEVVVVHAPKADHPAPCQRYRRHGRTARRPGGRSAD